MASDSATLTSLENLLNEFFDGATNNDRKKDIENLLHSFGRQDGSWKQCIYFLNNSTNYFVHMYSLSIFENLINQKWHTTPGSDKPQIRKFVHDFLISKYKQIPAFIRNKVIKVYVSIGKLEWPMFNPMFFSNIMQLLQNSNTAMIGVIALQMTSEEFIQPREDLSMTRRNELKETLVQHIPGALQVLSDILNTILLKCKRDTLTVTPPPSPNHHSPYHTPYQSPYESPYHTPNQSPHHSPSHQGSNSKIQTPSIKSSSASLQPLDHETEELCIAIFRCLSQYISWLPLSRIVTPALVIKIFNFAEYGCSAQPNGKGESNSAIGVHAMICINEILSKKFVPAEYEAFLFLMFQQAFNLLQSITKGQKSQNSLIIKQLDENFLEKITDFMALFVENHLRRFEPNNHFPTVELLYLLLKFTSIQQSPELYTQCLDIWNVFLDYIIDKVTSCITFNFKIAALEKYIACLRELLNEILSKIQFQVNDSWLGEIDMDASDDDQQTEWEKFLQPCLDLIEKLSQLLPEETYAKCSQIFEKNLDVYFGLPAIISGETLNISSENECKNLHASLLDLCTSFCIMGRLSSLFTDDINFKNRFEQAQSLVEKLIKAAMFGGYYKTYLLKLPQEELSKDLIETHAQSVASLQAFSHWLSKFHLSLSGNPDEKFEFIILSILDVLITLIGQQVPKKISLSAAHLLVSVVTAVRPKIFLTSDQGQKLYQNCKNILHGNPEEVQILVYRSLSSALILSWPSTQENDQNWELRSRSHESLLETICEDMLKLSNNLPSIMQSESEKEKSKPVIKQTCMIVSDIVDTAAGEGTTSRKIVHNSVKSLLSLCIDIFPIYVADSEIVDSILNFFLVCVKGLKVQMGTQAVGELISKLLELFNRERIVEIVQTGNRSGTNALEKFTKLLEFIVQEPDPNFKKLLPGVLSFALDQLLPVLNKFTVTDLKVNILELFHQLLLNNWRYFFKSNIISKMNGDDQLQHEELFVSILKEFGEPLLGSEISLFKTSLEIMENVNCKYHLYQKPIFQMTMLSSFLEVLLNALVQKSHNLLQEEIIAAIHNMVSSNFDIFFTQFIPHYLMNLKGLSDHQKSQLHQNFKRHQDIPSFSKSLEQFVGDLRYMQIVNSSLPQGSINL